MRVTTKKLIGKTIIWVLVLTLLWPNVTLAQTALSEPVEKDVAVPIKENLTSESEVQVLETTAHGVVLELVTPDPDVYEAFSENGPCNVLGVTGYGEMDKAGWPRFPVMGTLAGIPHHAEPALSILAADFVTLPGAYALCPVPQPVYEIDLEGQITYKGEAAIPDVAAYATDSFYPAEIVEIAETGLIRSQRVAQVRFHPFQVNPVTGVVKHYTRIRVLLQFGDDGEIPDASLTGQSFSASTEDAFDHLLAQIVANYDDARQWRETPSSHSTLLRQQFNAATSSQPTYKLTVDEDGLYEVTYAELAAAGVPVDTVDPRAFTLHTQGTEVALYVSGESDGIFDPGDAILFYGEKTNTKFTDVNVYWLTWGDGNGLRMAELEGTPTGNGAIPESFRATQRVEQNKIYQSAHPSGTDKDRWYWDFVRATMPTTVHYTTTLYAPAHSPLSATVRGLFKGYEATPHHHTQVSLNGSLIVDATWASRAEYTFSVDVPSSLLVAGVNTITLHVPMDVGITRDDFLVNRFEIEYNHAYVAVEDSLRFDGDAPGIWAYTVTGFTGAAVQAFDVTAPTLPVRILNVTAEADGALYTARFEQTVDHAHRYVVLTPAQFKRVLEITPAQPSDLRAITHGADYIIITHGDFYTDVLPLAGYRASQGLRTLIVDVQDIYDTFSDGIFDPVAIRDFLAYAYANWTAPAPAYVLLMGDGHYDFKNYFGRGELNYIPPFLADVDPWLGEVAADNRYVCVNGEDNLPDMHLGRLPVKTSAEAQVVVNKILDYEQNPAPDDWNQNVLFVTDNPDAAGDFYAYSDAIADTYVPAPYTVQKVYYGRTHTSATAARASIIEAVNEGRLLVNYIGHGSMTYWASEQLFRRSDSNALDNVGRLPVVLAMACLNGYYIHPGGTGVDVSSFAEALVRVPDKGAVAVWASTGMGTASAQDHLNKGMFAAIFADDVIELGAATFLGKLDLYTNAIWRRYHLDIYLLFGDPALRLNVLPADVSLTQSVDAAGIVQPGSTITYTLSFANSGPATAQRVSISTTLSSALVAPAVTWDGAAIVTRTGNALAWDVSALVAGQSGRITITGAITDTFSGFLINSVRIDTSAVDSDLSNNAPDPMLTAVYVHSGAFTSEDLAAFTAMPLNDTILLEWETANESNVAGFNLHRADSAGEPMVKLNDELIPAQSPGEALGAAYSFIDETTTPATPYVYWVEAVAPRGSATLHGPVMALAGPQTPAYYWTFLPVVFRMP